MSRFPRLQSSTPNRRQLGKIAVAATGLSLLSLPTAQAAASDIRNVSSSYRNQDAQKLLDLINNYRAQQGLTALRHSATIASVMDAEARRQFIQGYYSHGTEFIYNAKVSGYSFVREVIALSYQDDISQLLDFWKSSTAHRLAILAPNANTLGIGLCYGHGTSLPWRILGNVGIYRYEANQGPSDIQATVAGSSSNSTSGAGFPIRDGIASRYWADGGAAFYGQPTMAEQGGLIDGGAWQQFNKNGVLKSIYWHRMTGAHAIYESGAIAQFWRKNGAENSIGYPMMNRRGGLVSGGYWQKFRDVKGKHRSILWSPGSGAHLIYEPGAIARFWRQAGSERGYGYPLTEEYRQGVEVQQRFSSGVTIAWNSITGAVRKF